MKPPGKPCLRVFLQPKPVFGICQFPPTNELPNIMNVLFYDQVQHGYQYLISGARGGLGYLGFHSCSECGPFGTQRQGCRWPVLPNSLIIYLPTAQIHMPKENPFNGPGLPAGQNNPTCKGVSTLNPQVLCRHCWGEGGGV